MFNPAIADVLSFYQPLARTPAVSWTEDLPRGGKAAVLSLDCRDVRHVLFTSHCLDDGARLDITCCELESPIVARNILILSLLLDNHDLSRIKSIWDIYYHIRIDRKALQLLEIHANKLAKLGESLATWHNGPYGKSLRICDTGTLLELQKAWRTSATSIKKPSGKSRFEKNMQQSRDFEKTASGPDFISLTAQRTLAPLSAASSRDLAEIHRHYWDKGTTDLPSIRPQPTILNPTFVAQSVDSRILHYVTDPLLGFHLGAAYAPVISDGRPKLDDSLAATTNEAVREARLQFQEWTLSFKRAVTQGLTIRFYAGDALTFCHLLIAKKSKKRPEVCTYRGPNSFGTVSLNSEDYNASGNAPLTFDIVETSNLMNLVGPINLLVATAPLLKESPDAVIHTETLVRRESGPKSLAGSILTGDFPTISTLLGLLPMEYWTSATVTSAVTETTSKKSKAEYMYPKLTWKRLVMKSVSVIRYDPLLLAKLLYCVYCAMFEHMEPLRIAEERGMQAVLNASRPRYHQGSFVSLLHFVRNRDLVLDWDQMMCLLLDRVAGRRYLLTFQTLYCQLHLSGVYRYTPALLFTMKSLAPSPTPKGLHSWKNVPDTICITFNVPRKDLQAAADIIRASAGIPNMQCQIRGPGDREETWLNFFEVIQYGFGKVSTEGSPYSDDFKVHVVDDPDGWLGSSPMVVSFSAPTWGIMESSQTAILSLNIQNNMTNMRYLGPLGDELQISETSIADERNVFMTLRLPNQADEPASIHTRSFRRPLTTETTHSGRGWVSAVSDAAGEKVVGYMGRIDLESDIYNVLRRNRNTPVVTKQLSPFSIAVQIGDDTLSTPIVFPSPVAPSRSGIVLGTKSAYVEVNVSIADPGTDQGFVLMLFPLSTVLAAPTLWNMPRVLLDKLLILDLSQKKQMKWLGTHCSMQFSSSERRHRKPNNEVSRDHRVNLKESLYSLFMRFSSQHDQGLRIFALHSASHGEDQVLIFPSCLRLDPANRTVVMDCAVIVLTHALRKTLKAFLAAIAHPQRCRIRIDDIELYLWDQTIPTFVERCRDWNHRRDCEYVVRGYIPLTDRPDEQLLCSCALNKIPKDYLTGIPEWESARKHAVRAAISPVFASPFVEDLVNPPPVPVKPEISASTSASASSSSQPPAAPAGPPPKPIDLTCCHVCGKENSQKYGVSLSFCARCGKVKYCSAECQKKDWRSHKSTCLVVAAGAGGSGGPGARKTVSKS